MGIISLEYQKRLLTEKRLELALLIEAIKFLDVEQVTLYEMRYNQNGILSGHMNRDLLFEQYNYFLPIEDIVAKYISISLYNGCFDIYPK